MGAFWLAGSCACLELRCGLLHGGSDVTSDNNREIIVVWPAVHEADALYGKQESRDAVMLYLGRARAVSGSCGRRHCGLPEDWRVKRVAGFLNTSDG